MIDKASQLSPLLLRHYGILKSYSIVTEKDGTKQTFYLLKNILQIVFLGLANYSRQIKKAQSRQEETLSAYWRIESAS